MKKILLSFLIIVAGYAFYVCNQKIWLMQNEAAKHQEEMRNLKEEMANLKKENTELKDNVAQLETKNKDLEEQVAELSENEQNKFNKAYDLLNNAKESKDFRIAEEAFALFLDKYPVSKYVEQAKKAQKKAQTKAQHLEWTDKQRITIKQQIKDKKWDAAEETVNSLEKYIAKEEYEKYKKTIYDEKNKPIETTIANLISYQKEFDEKRIKINATCQSINLAEKYLYVEDSGFSIQVKYGGSGSVVARFANNPRCNNVKIVGKFVAPYYSSFFGYFIDRRIYAESIEDLF